MWTLWLKKSQFWALIKLIRAGWHQTPRRESLAIGRTRHSQSCHWQHHLCPGLVLTVSVFTLYPSSLKVNRKNLATLWNVQWIKLWMAKWHSETLAFKNSLSLTQHASPCRACLCQMFVLPRVALVTKDNEPSGVLSWSPAYGPLPSEQLPCPCPLSSRPPAQNILWPAHYLGPPSFKPQLMCLPLPEATGLSHLSSQW